MSQKILKRINKLEERLDYPEDLEDVREWKKQIQDIMLKDNLKKHEGIQMIIDKIKQDIVEISIKLNTANSEELPDRKRDNLLDKKELYLWFLDFFADTKEEMKSIAEQVEANEKYIKETIV